MFPNRFNVYLHDTPSKSLFDRDLRIFSHGCMRVQNPLDLAELILADQGWSRERIDATIAQGGQRIVNLKNPIPVHVTYLTAWVNKDGAVNFRRDPYKRDDQLVEALDRRACRRSAAFGVLALRAERHKTAETSCSA